jgi:RND family efflux transporter MFP subunit
MKLLKYAVFIIIAAGAGLLFYKKVYVPNHTFKIITAKKADMNIKIEGVGNVGSEDTYKVSAVFGGRVNDFNISIGQFIKKNRLIAKIDSIDLNKQIKSIKENINVVKASIQSLKADKESAYKDYLYQEDVLKKNTKLYQKKAISELEYKKYLTNRDVAKLKVNSLGEKIVSLQNQIKQSEANIAALEEKLKRYTIKAPVSGYVTKKYISNYDTVGNFQPVIEIVSPKDVWVDTFIDTRISGGVKINDKAVIHLRSGADLKGYVYKINPVNNAVTNEREIFVKFNKTPVPFYINEQATVNIKTANLKNMNTIPVKAVAFYSQKEGVWILKDGKAHFIPVKILAHSGNMVAIEKSGLKIIMPDPKKKTLKEGMKIYND